MEKIYLSLSMEQVQNKKYNFTDTSARKKVWALRKRFRAVKGGTSASKTISIMYWHIDYCQQKRQTPTISTIASETYPHLEAGVIRDFKAIMKDRGYWDEDRWNATKHFYTFETGNVLEFLAVDTYGKAHGPRRDTLWLNECQYLSWIIVDQLVIRTRKIIWMDWNPTEEFWFHEELLPHRMSEIDYITLNYKDNEALDEVSIREIESHQHDKNWWQVYGLGEDGEIQTRIYTGWGFLDEIPADARLKVKGLDFGYTNDPTALVNIYEWDNAYVIDELIYQRGMVNPEIAKAIGEQQPITIGDGAEPKSIAEIAQYGITIIGSKKGKGTVSQGIDSVRSKKIFVTKRSLNIIKEYRNYIYLKDDAGKITNEPRDLFNHAMDAIRYAISFLNPKRDVKEYDNKILHETPSINDIKSPMPIPTLSATSRADFLQKLKKNRASNTSNFETDVPWQRPGLK